MVANCGLLAEGFGVLGRPVLVSEQYPKGLGHTVAELAERLPADARLVEKVRFSACGVDAFEEAMAQAGVRTWVVAGIESPRLREPDRRTTSWSAASACRWPPTRSPRGPRATATSASRRWPPPAPGTTSAEMALFEMLERAGSDEFKQISRLVR